jgi:hypothetical protein
MLKIAEKHAFQARKKVKVCHKAGNQTPIRIFSIIAAEVLSG